MWRTIYAGKQPGDLVGTYTMVFPGSSDPVTSPGGDGIDVVKVTSGGVVSLAGTLADGTPVRQKAIRSKNGNWLLYLPLYSGKGSMLGWVTLSNQVTSSITGEVSWIKAAAAGGKYYPGGFSNELSVIGSQYQPSSDRRLVFS